ncbi:mechanosensitive ion channel domain-containing protein, partial [Candidatus Albibeggiatoa sp. nov. NOAA]|uniref:mechanosensitive ion channel family protein n=1 Tax=Candidatus Albibeggiatoa sp. nov. NOAA TaxID=3162724 RepID=UPI0032F69E89|nr:mechanosensitive ion channel [Thiotrichaceae bacterium]
MSGENVDTATITEKAVDLAKQYGPNILMAIAIFIIGKIFVKLIASLICKGMRKSNVDETLVKFAQSLLGFVGMVFVIIAALAKLGIPTASMVAAVGAIGLAIGLSLQGALSNFAAGILIVTFRPFKVGDLVKISDEVGTVREIDLFTTKIITPDNKTLIVPNS